MTSVTVSPRFQVVIHRLSARQAAALVWTQDADFERLAGVKFWRRV